MQIAEYINKAQVGRCSLRWVSVSFLMLLCLSAHAATYNITSGSYPPCTTSWSVVGTTYTCNGGGAMALASGDILTASTNITLSIGNSITLNNNTIGSSGARINLVSTGSSITATGTNTIYGNLQAASGAVTLANTTLNGTITSNSTISLTGGSVSGLVNATSLNIVTNGTTLSGGATANTGISITGGTVSGSFTMMSNNPVTFTNTVMISGSISGASTITLNGSVIGSSTNSVSVTATSGAISMTGSTAFGSFTAPSYSTVNVTTSRVIGTCSPGSTPSGACSGSVPTYCSNIYAGGIKGDYYANETLASPVTGNRVDGPISFDWVTAAPGVLGIGADGFSIRWDGYVRVTTTGSYQFQTASDDGVRLYVNNQTMVNNWTLHGITTNTSGNIGLLAGEVYPLRLEFYEHTGGATIRLLWQVPGSGSFVAVPAGPTPSLGAGIYYCGSNAVAYYGISHSGTGITCAGEPVTITAYNSAGTAVAPTAGTVVSLATSPSGGTWVGGASYTFAGTETSFVKYLQQTTAATLNINVSDGSVTESASIDPSITFVDSALKFYGSSAMGAMANQVAGVADSAPILQAIRTDTSTGACVAQVTGSRTVNMAYVCRNPITCASGQTFSVNGTSIQANANAALASPTYASVNLTFDGTGTASIPISFSDVGQVRLLAQLPLTAVGTDPAKTLTGASTDFVVKPYALAVSRVETLGGTSNPGATSASGSGAGFVSAGTAFRVNVEARNSGGNRTPNFGNETATENNIQLTNLTLVYPSGGTATALTGATSFSATSPSGTFTSSTVSWGNVGSFTLQARLADNDYLGAGDIASPSTSGTIGRIYPDHFRLVSSAVSNSCGGFTYMGQPGIGLSYSLQAETASNAPVTNYGGNYSLTLPSYVAENANGGNGASLSSRLAIGGSATWVNGVYNFVTTAASFSRQTSTAPDGPYTSLQLGLTLTDSFDNRAITVLDMDANATGTCSSCSAKTLGSPLNARFGRLRMDDAFGPETVALPVNLVTEYWTGNYLALNTDDSCTLIPRSAITYPSGTLASDANRTVALSSGTTQGTYTTLDGAGVYINAGSAGHTFSKPSSGGTGSFIVGIDLTNLSWLRYDWNQDGNYSDAALPNTNIGFGSYRGHDRVIYWREKLQ